MMSQFSAIIGALSFAVALGVGFDTTAGENPVSALALDSSAQSGPQADLELEAFNAFAAANLRLKILYGLAVSCVAGMLICIYRGRGFASVVSILAYVGALASMSMLIRNCYVNNGFKYPQFLTATHFIATAMAGTSVLTYRRLTTGQQINVPDFQVFVKGLLPVAVAFVLSLGFANNGLLLTNAHFYEMVGSSTPLVTAFLAFLLGRGFDMRLMPALGMITVSMLVIAFGEIALSTLGLLACVGGVIMRAAKSTLQHSLMGGSEWKAMDPIQVAVWTSLTCFLLMSIWSVATEGATPFREILAWGPFMAVLYTCIGASILNIAALFVLRELGPVAQQIVGQLKGIISIIGAVVIFGEQVTRQQVIGYAILVCGICWYNQTDMKIKEEKARKLAIEGDETSKIQKV